MPPLVGAADLRALPSPADTPDGCACAALNCPGWESVSAPAGPPLLQCIGSLRDSAVDEPTLAEQPGEGRSYWSPTALIDPAFFPYNRCSVWRCTSCGRGFLQYTEAGGYYVDHRLRAVDPALVVG